MNRISVVIKMYAKDKSTWFIMPWPILSLIYLVNWIILLAIVEKSLSGWGSELHFFNLPYLNDGNLLEQFWIFFATLLHLYFLGAVISGVYLRYSGKGVYTFMTILLLISTIYSFFATRLGWWMDIFNWLKTHTAFELASWMGLIAIFYALITYLPLRRATVQ